MHLPPFFSERKRMKVSAAVSASPKQVGVKGKPEASAQLLSTSSSSRVYRMERQSTPPSKKKLGKGKPQQPASSSPEHLTDITDAISSTVERRQNNSSRDGKARFKRKREIMEEDGSAPEHGTGSHESRMGSIELEKQKAYLEQEQKSLEEKRKHLESWEASLSEWQARLIQAEETHVSEAEKTLSRLEEEFSCSL